MQNRPKPPSPSQLLKQVNHWNEHHAIGDHVRHFPVLGDTNYTVERIAGVAYILGDHTAVVKLSARAGCFALDNLEPMEPAE